MSVLATVVLSTEVPLLEELSTCELSTKHTCSMHKFRRICVVWLHSFNLSTSADLILNFHVPPVTVLDRTVYILPCYPVIVVHYTKYQPRKDYSQEFYFYQTGAFLSFFGYYIIIGTFY